MPESQRYVLVSPVKDEEALIGETIASVTAQSVLPVEWVIVSDGSTDRTEEIVQRAATRFPWIRLVRLPQRAARSFAAVVRATEAGVRAITVADYEYIGLLDADLRFGPDYFETVMQRFQACPRLGLGGGMVVDRGERRRRPPLNQQDVPGAAQFFRRKCFMDLGGLLAVPEGGWDALTCLKARMVGYETRLFADLVIEHLKPRNISEGGWLRRTWKMGVRDYALGYHPLFELLKCIWRFRDRPAVIGALLWLAGYCWFALTLPKRMIPLDLLEFCHAEQRARIRRSFKNVFCIQKRR